MLDNNIYAGTGLYLIWRPTAPREIMHDEDISFLWLTLDDFFDFWYQILL